MDTENFGAQSTPTKRNFDNETDQIDSEYVTPKKYVKKIDTMKQKNKRLQKYKNQWEIEHGGWLTNDPQNEYNGKCKLCGIIFTIASAGIGQVKQHLQTKQHKSKSEMKKTSGLLEKFLDTSSAFTSSKSSFCSDKENVAAELALTYHTVKHNLSYNSMDSTIKLNKTIYVNSSGATGIRLARTKMEALVTEVLGPYASQNVINDIKTENLYYCLQTDASNKKNIKLFPLVIQYFTAKNGIQNKLVDFYENSNESANGMFEAIQNSLEQYQLSFHNVSALSADNTNANFGINHSLFTNMRDLVPGLIKGNCHAHIVHNCVKHAMSFLSYDIENVILKIYVHFSHSAVRRDELKRFIASVDGDFHEVKRHVGTRWLSLLPCTTIELVTY